MREGEHTTKPRLGDRRIVTADELGEHAVTIVNRSTSERVAPVRELLKNGTSAQALFAQQYVRSSHRPGEVVARTKAIAATGIGPGDVALSAVYTVDFSAAFSQQAETLRWGTNSIFLKRGESVDVFGFVGPWHLGERWSFLQADFCQVQPGAVEPKTLMAVRDWMRGVDLRWFKLPSLKAAEVAEKLWTDIEALKEAEDEIIRAYSNGVEPDPRVIRRREFLKVGLEAYGIFLGFQHAFEVEREPSVDALLAAKGPGSKGLIIDQN
ncbi:MAG: hypothetical protein CTY20_09135 [Hyphomicrobium sp.]|nr:MAG: hypothetical protein CTY20_09135 [Hyphomicrobium sp.]